MKKVAIAIALFMGYMSFAQTHVGGGGTNGTAAPKTSPFVWSSTVGLGLTNTGNGSADFTPIAAITIKRFQVHVVTQAATCTTSAIVAVYDSTTSTALASITIANATGDFDSGVVTQNVASGDVLQIRITTAAAGCGTSPSGTSFVVQYNPQ